MKQPMQRWFERLSTPRFGDFLHLSTQSRSAKAAVRMLPLLLPLLPVMMSFWLLKSDAGAFIIWWIALTVPGLLFLPLAGRVFSLSPDKGYLFAKPLALLLSSLAVWTLSYLHILPFRSIFIYVILISGAILVHLSKANRSFWADVPKQPGILLFWSIEEMMLGFTSLFWTFARGLSPSLDSLEKFMDYGFMMTLWRTDFLPAKDIWLAGSPINYYYFGQYLATFWAKTAGIHPEKAYNLAMASLFALTFCLTFAVALLIGALAVKASRRVAKIFPIAFAAASSILLTFGGNGHFFYYGGNPIGQWMLGLFKAIGLQVGNISKTYWFADATRYIGYNPETTDKTIHEFPYYSFLVADLHAHVVSLVPVLLVLGILTALVARRQYSPKPAASAPHTYSFDPVMILLAMMLAIFMMGNYWDFVIYFAVSFLVLLVSAPANRSNCPTVKGLLLLLLLVSSLLLPFMLIQNVYQAMAAYLGAVVLGRFIESRYKHPLTTTGARASELFLLAHLVALPFNAQFEPIAKKISRTVSHTPLVQLWVLYGFLFLAGLVFVIDLLKEQRNEQIRRISRFDRPRFRGPDWSEQSNQNPVVSQAAPELIAFSGHDRADEPTNQFFSRLHMITPADRLMLIFLVCGIGLILIPELVYVVDIYSGDYKRANTMFKFTYQAFILLSLVLAYMPLLLMFKRSQKSSGSILRKTAGLILLILFIPSLLYPIGVTSQWLGAFSQARYQGIDGIRLFAQKDSPDIPGTKPGELADDYAAVQWFNQSVAGQPVILESFGDSYTDFCRISAYTGLPTVIGWQTHEWLWRTSRATPDAYGSVVAPRQTDVRTMYTSTDASEVTRLLSQYQVRYLVIGNLERQKFSTVGVDGAKTSLINEQLLLSLGRIAFRSNDLVVIERQPFG